VKRGLGRIELDLGLFATEDFEGQGEQSLSLVLGAGYRLRETIELELDWPLVFYNSDEFSMHRCERGLVSMGCRSAPGAAQPSGRALSRPSEGCGQSAARGPRACSMNA
jgi:hypothetical protein